MVVSKFGIFGVRATAPTGSNQSFVALLYALGGSMFFFKRFIGLGFVFCPQSTWVRIDVEIDVTFQLGSIFYFIFKMKKDGETDVS